MPFKRLGGDSLRLHGGVKKKEYTGTKAYNRFFEGYTEYVTVDSKGKKKTRRIYTDDFFSKDISARKKIALKLGYALALVVSVCLMLYAGRQPITRLLPWYAELPQAASVFFIGMMLYVFVYYIPAKDNMTAYVYRKSTGPMRTASLGLAISLCAAALFAAVSLLTRATEKPSLSDISYILCYLAAGGIEYGVYRVEKGIRYVRVRNYSVVPHGSDYYHVINDVDGAVDN